MMSNQHILLPHVLAFLTNESELLGSAGIELLFGITNSTKPSVPRPAAKVMTIAASACSQCSAPPVTPAWPSVARAQTSRPTPSPPINNPRPAPPRQVNNVPNITNNAPRPIPKFDYNYCTFCERPNHNVVGCTRFISGSPEARSNFIHKKGLCYRCLQSGHGSTHCKSLEKCSVCGSRHHTTLHGTYVTRYPHPQADPPQVRASAPPPLMSS